MKITRRLLFVGASGLVGLFVLFLSWLVFIRLVISHLFGSALSVWENIVIVGIVPLIIVFGSAIPAWVLGVNLWRGFLAGMLAMIGFVTIFVNGGRVNYGPYIEYETVAFVVAVLISVIVATIGRNKLGVLLTQLVLAAVFIMLRFVLPGKDVSVHFVIIISSWTILPLVSAFIANTKREDKLN